MLLCPPNTIKGPAIKSQRLEQSPGLFCLFPSHGRRESVQAARTGFRMQLCSPGAPTTPFTSQRGGSDLKHFVECSALCLIAHKTLLRLQPPPPPAAELLRPSVNVRFRVRVMR